MNIWIKLFFLTLSLAARAADIEMVIMGTVDPDAVRKETLRNLVSAFYMDSIGGNVQPHVLFVPTITALPSLKRTHAHIETAQNEPIIRVTNKFFDMSLPYATRLSPLQGFMLEGAIQRSKSSHELVCARLARAASWAHLGTIPCSVLTVVGGSGGAATANSEGAPQEPWTTMGQVGSYSLAAGMIGWFSCERLAKRALHNGETECLEKICDDYDSRWLALFLKRYTELYPDQPENFRSKYRKCTELTVDHPELVKQVLTAKLKRAQEHDEV